MAVKIIKAKPLKTAAMQKELERGMKRVNLTVQRFFKITVSTWKRKPKFKRELEVTSKSIIARVITEDEIYGYVSGGTKPHTIRPKRGKALAFRTGYTPKTHPGGLFPTVGGAHGNTAFAQEVHHPGTEAREFPKTIKRMLEPYMLAEMQEAMKKAAKASGHGGKK